MLLKFKRASETTHRLRRDRYPQHVLNIKALMKAINKRMINDLRLIHLSVDL